MLRRVATAVLLSLPLLFFALFYFYPTGAILQLGLAPEGRLDLNPFVEVTTSSYFWRVLWFTVWQALLSTLLTLLLAFPGAYVLARYRFPGKSVVRAIATLPFVLPTVLVAVAFTALIGPQGIVNNWLVDLFGLAQPPIRISQTVWIILLAHVFYNYSVALRIITTYWQTIPDDLAEAAQMLGASPWRAFWAVTFPALRPAIMAAAVLVFVFCFTSFGVIVILGGPRFATLEVEIYRQTLNFLNLPVAAALSIWQIAFTFLLMWFYTRTQANLARPQQMISPDASGQPLRSTASILITVANAGLIIVLVGAPLLAMISRSFRGVAGPTLAFYRELFTNRTGSVFFVPPGEAVLNSVLFAVTAMLLSTAVGLLSVQLLTRGQRHPNHATPALSRVLDPLFMLPIATSAVTLGLGYLVSLDQPPLDLRSSIVLVPIAHALVAVPFVLRSVLPASRSIRPSLREAAAILGASNWRVWREVDWPLLRRALLVGAVFAFTISMGEFGATVFLARPQTPTMPVAIFRFLGQPGALNYGQALAMSSILLLICAIAFLLIERAGGGRDDAF